MTRSATRDRGQKRHAPRWSLRASRHRRGDREYRGLSLDSLRSSGATTHCWPWGSSRGLDNRAKSTRGRRQRCEGGEDDISPSIGKGSPPHWRALVLVNAYAVMRWSEVVGLALGSVDWQRRMLSVTETGVEVAGHIHREPTKTEAGRRTITLPGFVMDALAEHVERWPPGELGLIFHDRNGQPVRRSTFYRSWRRRRSGRAFQGSRFETSGTPGRRWRWRAERTFST